MQKQIKHPIEIPINLTLEVKKELKKEKALEWQNIVKQFAPENTVDIINLVSNKKQSRKVIMVKKKLKDGTYNYVIPLKRHLLSKETKAIFQEWSEVFEGDFDVIPSGEFVDNVTNVEFTQEDIDIKHDSHEILAENFAKFEHKAWVRQRSDEGWSYGTKINRETKRHPLMRSWHELPKSYRKIDLSLPQRFIECLNEMGYAVVDRNKLEALKEKKRK